MDELLDLMEWTRQRVGKDGLVIVHNTTTPTFAVDEISADYVVATEWGYGTGPTAHRISGISRWNGRWRARSREE